MHRVKLRRLSGNKRRLSVGITIPKAILEHEGLIEGESLTGEYHTFLDYDADERVLKVPIPEPADAETANTPEEALVDREQEQSLSPGEREVLTEHASTGTMEGN
jgi:hypothetical protein